ADYSFAVFQLKELQGKPHPMAFEFETRHGDEIFFPTVHIHDGEVHARELFDHTLYLQNIKFDKVVGRYANYHSKDRSTGFVRSKDVARQYCNIQKSAGILEPDLLLHRIEMRGRLPNKDVFAAVQPKRGKPTGYRLGQILPIAPLLGLCGLSWFFNRRNEVQSQDEV
ncbi:MAG: hypothetical protein AAF483_21195, partial [Planctomycetota bacterium]